MMADSRLPDPTVRRDRPWWLWPHLLSWDAVAVGVVWQLALAKAFALPWHVGYAIALGATLAGIYMGDRRLDVRSGRPIPATDRHAFHAEFRIFTAIFPVIFLLIGLFAAVWTLPPSVLATGAILGVLMLAYAWSVHGSSATAGEVSGSGATRRWRLPRVPKEWLVGGLFTLGVAMPLLAADLTLMPLRLVMMLPTLVAFFALVIVNCRLISSWETDRTVEFEELRNWGCLVLALPMVPMIVSGFLPFTKEAMAIRGTGIPDDLRSFSDFFRILQLAPVVFMPFILSMNLAMLGLFLLDSVRGRCSPRLLRVLADVVLLTPIIGC
ncbi:hypothetical protein [Tuwongella immobilis]|uniref:Uncharacterized protein n=1 Tax=Tuwongella immobilis TaxID=692036 RepID=A0A6C2YJB8_9BACT|nr:hypothetical protein [Tuwongella immobilis]VIP01213.1 Putative membrane protein OS=Rhodopirellula sallentina SM41 GN=RSSM_03562 PE=4 SV=1 [Tuwongella immobilis]VTR97852.1 Putative membrane protein OS=Rhodopirellula sallentina SM41 GN=RSSM_03562 PE=4 SV=1 [Tuwongella immobilis]